MTFAVMLALVGLALVDSTSVGTLLLPIAMLAHDRLRAGRVVLYLAVIAGFYWALGLALLAGADRLLQVWSRVGETRTAAWVLLAVGVAMLVGSFWPDTPWGKRRREAAAAGGDRQARWRDRLVGEGSRPGAVVAVALAAGVAEAATMLPYLGAVGLISASGVPGVGGALLLTGYVVVMVAPALVLLALRMTLDARLRPVLARANALVARHTAGAMWWVVGVIGFLLAADSGTRLGLWGAGPTG